jgi:hypothetical protein
MYYVAVLVLDVPRGAYAVSGAKLAAVLSCVCGCPEARWESAAWRWTGGKLMACELIWPGPGSRAVKDAAMPWSSVRVMRSELP